MSFISLAFSSDGAPFAGLARRRARESLCRRCGPAGRIASERLCALGVTPGAPVTVLQTFPGVVFMCDQTELAVERASPSHSRRFRGGPVMTPSLRLVFWETTKACNLSCKHCRAVPRAVGPTELTTNARSS